MPDITATDRGNLISAAVKARENSHSPYSKFAVGAAVLGVDGKIYSGCNIENVSYGLTNCAERTAIFNMVSQGCKGFVAVAVSAGDKPSDSAPCGACRQVMCEFAADFDNTAVFLCDKEGNCIEEKLSALCPYPFLRFNGQE